MNLSGGAERDIPCPTHRGSKSQSQPSCSHAQMLLTPVGWTLESPSAFLLSLGGRSLSVALRSYPASHHHAHRLVPLTNSIFAFCLSPGGAISDFSEILICVKACLPRMTWIRLCSILFSPPWPFLVPPLDGRQLAVKNGL